MFILQFFLFNTFNLCLSQLNSTSTLAILVGLRLGLTWLDFGLVRLDSTSTQVISTRPSTRTDFGRSWSRLLIKIILYRKILLINSLLINYLVD